MRGGRRITGCLSPMFLTILTACGPLRTKQLSASYNILRTIDPTLQIHLHKIPFSGKILPGYRSAIFRT